MEKNNKTLESLLKIHNILTLISKKPRDFGTGGELYFSEIHTIVAIKGNPGINLTQLSEILGVSKSAVSKFVKKLSEKDYIIKSRPVDNQREVMFNLTDKGEIVFQGHEKFSHEKFKKVYNILDNTEEEEVLIINNFLEKVYQGLSTIE